jgi:hypothetical protein
MQQSRYCGLPLTPHFTGVASQVVFINTGPAPKMEWAMTTYTDGEAYGAKGFTWAIIVAAALLMMEVTWPQALPASPQATATMTNMTVAAHPDHDAQAS